MGGKGRKTFFFFVFFFKSFKVYVSVDEGWGEVEGERGEVSYALEFFSSATRSCHGLFFYKAYIAFTPVLYIFFWQNLVLD